MGLGLNFKNQKETKNENHISVNNDSLSSQMLEMLSQINLAVGSLKTSIDIVSKQIDKLSQIDDLIRAQQLELEKRIIRVEYDIDKIFTKLNIK